MTMGGLFTEAVPAVGEITINNGLLIIDADPYVMQKVRGLFPGSVGAGKGSRTHAVIGVPQTPEKCKDILWLLERYPMIVSPTVMLLLEQGAKAYDSAIDAVAGRASYVSSAEALQFAIPLLPNQASFQRMARILRKTLLADPIGEGKTGSAISTLVEPDARHALIVVQPHLCTQWQRVIQEFLPDLSTHVITGTRPYPLPQVGAYITGYNRLQYWQDVLVPMAPRTIIFDEVQELRRIETKKRQVARALAEKAVFSYGLSGTPMYNWGSEIWSVLDAISPGCLGTARSFLAEWCDFNGRVKDTRALHSYLTSTGLMIRRKPEPRSEVTRQVVTLDADLQSLSKVQDAAKALAMAVLGNKVGDSGSAARELDWKLRQATGVAKARPVAAYVRMIAEQEGRVLLAGWHREVYDIWLRELKDLNPVLYTGTESVQQKDRARQAFIDGKSKVFCISLRSGAGLDGLQQVCRHVVFGELDWSPHVMDQVVGRLARRGQTEQVCAHFLAIEDGSDPFMIDLVGAKRTQHEGIIDGQDPGAAIMQASAPMLDRVREMAKAIVGDAAEEGPAVTGLQADIVSALSRIRFRAESEREMQEQIAQLAPTLVDAIWEREYRLSERSRLDFRVSRGAEVVAIECKLDQINRASAYRQVRRYIEEGAANGVVIVAPWSGVATFEIDGVPVCVVDPKKASL